MNKNYRKSEIINAFDIETLSINSRVVPICVSYSYKRNLYGFYGYNCLVEAVDHLSTLVEREKMHIFYIHNINFDGLLLIEMLSLSHKFTISAMKMSIYNIRLYLGNAVVEWRCSYKLLPLSLKTVALEFTNLRKLPFPYYVLNESYDESLRMLELLSEEQLKDFEYAEMSVRDYMVKYCKNDVLITKKFVEKYWEILADYHINKNDNLYSAPSIAVNLYFKKYNNFNVKKNLDKWEDNYIRRAYYGGRCEVYGNPRKNEHIFHFDFSGMYAQCMEESFHIGNSSLIYKDFNLATPGFYDIEWKTNMNLPILPMKDEATGKLMFYTGNGYGVYWYEEIQLFIEHGGSVVKINSGLVYERTEQVFLNFINGISKIKDMGGAYKILGKLLINSTYGRLGMGRDSTRTVVCREIPNSPNLLRYYQINSVVIAELEVLEQFKGISNVGLAAAITSKARVKLYKAFISVIENGGRLLYTDTDSVVAAFNENVIGRKHGEVYWNKSKADTHVEKACFALPKTYSIIFKNGEWITKIKGMKRNHISYEDFASIFERYGDVIDNDFLNIKKKAYILKIEHTSKSTSLSTYNKRLWIDERTNTLPFKR